LRVSLCPFASNQMKMLPKGRHLEIRTQCDKLAPIVG